MLTQEQNERLTRVGPGTLAGELLRRVPPFASPSYSWEKAMTPLQILGKKMAKSLGFFQNLVARFVLPSSPRRIPHLCRIYEEKPFW